ncbi:hypothetical protein KIPB_006349 [Kipferlia bialata]|uniref:Uncharacterized protein n=1 Tax=Kipferlia bialata TaxID=797122 RepID=A0A9K3CYU7_9EUKA|nr:hypothetical protein KIPB_006349 [Kipferlia bialata]|eukprot:g6349.t1
MTDECDTVPQGVQDCTSSPLVLHPDSPLCCILYPRTLVVLDVSHAPPTVQCVIHSFPDSISCAAWAPTDTAVLAVATCDGSISLIDVDTSDPGIHLEAEEACQHVLETPLQSVPVSVCFHPSVPDCIMFSTYTGEVYCGDAYEEDFTLLHKADHAVVSMLHGRVTESAVPDGESRLSLCLVSDGPSLSFISVVTSPNSDSRIEGSVVTLLDVTEQSLPPLVCLNSTSEHALVALGTQLHVVDAMSGDILVSHDPDSSSSDIVAVSLLLDQDRNFITCNTDGALTLWSGSDLTPQGGVARVKGEVKHLLALSASDSGDTAAEGDSPSCPPIRVLVSMADGAVCMVQEGDAEVTPIVPAFPDHDPSDGIYEGERNEEGEPHGEGTLTCLDGYTYTGGWKEGARHGYGSSLDRSGLLYEGEFVDNKRTGRGTLSGDVSSLLNGGRGNTLQAQELKTDYPKGFIMEGVFEDGHFVSGTLTNPGTGMESTYGDYGEEGEDGVRPQFTSASAPNGATYEGVLGTNVQGYGKYRYKDGGWYEGGMKDGEYWGQGTMHYPTGEVHSGLWRDGKRQGKGTFTFANGDVYEGYWKDHHQCGMGTLRTVSGITFRGTWKNGQRRHGTETFRPDGRCHGSYTGSFKDGKWHGQGVFRGTYGYQAGDVLTGGWRNGVMDGVGTLRKSDGSLYEGGWRDNKKSGHGTMTYANGDIVTGEWANDRLVSKEDTPSGGPLSDQTLEAIVTRQIRLPYNGTLGDLGANYGEATMEPNCTVLLYIPDTAKGPLGDFCRALATLTLSVCNLSAAKSPSALKKELASAPQLVVCTHGTVWAQSGSRLYKLHTAIWRELAKREASVRVFMCLDEEEIHSNEAAARALYTELVDIVKTLYVDKLPQETQTELYRRADTLQCMPLSRYFEDVWGDVCWKNTPDRDL